MAFYEQAFDFLMQHEDPKRSGVVVKDPSRSHPEAVARFGINSGANPKAVTDGFYEMDTTYALAYAVNFYKYKEWAQIGGYQVADQKVANKWFDLTVNEGFLQATRIVQRAVNTFHPERLVVDGKPGQKTIDAVNLENPSDLLYAIKAQAKDFYIQLAKDCPAEAPNLVGWLRRVDA